MSARTLFGVVLAAMLLPAAAQTPATPATAPAAEAPKPRPPLKLRLDEADLRSLAPAAPKDAEKQSDAGLPSLGGGRSPALDRKPSDVVPKDLTPGL
ncbi:MAG TPA: hypothetical protein VE325_06720 [Burkholderiales bacterium]|nr:hypothetical protein [Burkholderiales bacterium]